MNHYNELLNKKIKLQARIAKLEKEVTGYERYTGAGKGKSLARLKTDLNLLEHDMASLRANI